MRELNTIQKREKLNFVFAIDEPGNGGANHEYEIIPAVHIVEQAKPMISIQFQNGPRKDPISIAGGT